MRVASAAGMRTRPPMRIVLIFPKPAYFQNVELLILCASQNSRTRHARRSRTVFGGEGCSCIDMRKPSVFDYDGFTNYAVFLSCQQYFRFICGIPVDTHTPASREVARISLKNKGFLKLHQRLIPIGIPWGGRGPLSTILTSGQCAPLPFRDGHPIRKRLVRTERRRSY